MGAGMAIRRGTAIHLVRLRRARRDSLICGRVRKRYTGGTHIRLIRMCLKGKSVCSSAAVGLGNSTDDFEDSVNCVKRRARVVSVGRIIGRFKGRARDRVGINNTLHSNTGGVFHKAVSFGANSSSSIKGRLRGMLVLNSSIRGGAIPIVLYSRRGIINGRNTAVKRLSRSAVFCFTDHKVSGRRTRGVVTETGVSHLGKVVGSSDFTEVVSRRLKRI